MASVVSLCLASIPNIPFLSAGGFPRVADSSINGTSPGRYVAGSPRGNTRRLDRMITTILAVVALSGSLAPAARPEFQAQTDYSQALKRAADEKKPIAVLIAKGDGFAKLMADGGLSADAKKL